jgi:hypothetical protein
VDARDAAFAQAMVVTAMRLIASYEKYALYRPRQHPFS